MNPPGLRERKKQQTRDALVDAAYALFGRKGYDTTTVEEIAETADVSPRTFFRYFMSKEDAALAPLDLQFTEVMTALAARPAGEPVLSALRDAAVEVVRTHETTSPDRKRYQGMQQLLAGTPALTAAALGRGSARLDELAQVLAARMGVDPHADPRPGLLASVALCAVPTAVTAWQETDRRPTSELLHQAFDLLMTGLDYPAGPR